MPSSLTGDLLSKQEEFRSTTTNKQFHFSETGKSGQNNYFSSNNLINALHTDQQNIDFDDCCPSWNPNSKFEDDEGNCLFINGCSPKNENRLNIE